MPPSRPARLDPFAPLAPLAAALSTPPLPPVVALFGDDDWIVSEAVRRLTAAFRAAFPESETSTYDATGGGVTEAVADAATVALFSTNRLVALDATELLHARKLTADEVDALLDEAAEAGPSERRVLERCARKARALAAAAGHGADADPHETAKKVTGRVRRSERAPELAALLALPVEEGEATESALDRLMDYVTRAPSGDNVLLVHALSPDADHAALGELRRHPHALLLAPDGEARRERLAQLGLERTIERGLAVDADVFDTLTERGRLSARAFLTELDKLCDSAANGRVTAEAAARLVVDERKEYGSDFVDAVVKRRFLDALKVLERLLSATEEFTAFRPFGKGEAAPARKGPKGEAAFFPLLGLLAGEVRRILAFKAALAEPWAQELRRRRADYRSFQDRVLPALRNAPPGAPPVPLDGHPFVLHKAYLASFDWPLDDLLRTLEGIAAIDRGVKSGAGTGRDLLESLLLQLHGTAAR